jgi:hypothetical protein
MVSMVLGLSAGLSFGFLAVLVNRRLATVFMVAPISGWFVLLAIAVHVGLTSVRTTQLGLGLLGVLLGLAIGQALDKRDHVTRPPR